MLDDLEAKARAALAHLKEHLESGDSASRVNEGDDPDREAVTP